MFTKNNRRFLPIVFAATLIAAACGDDTTEPEAEPEVATMRITVGTQTTNVDAETGTVTGAPITVAAGSTTPISITFLRSDGTADPLVAASTFRADVTSASTARVTFTRVGPFNGTLQGVSAGTTSLNIALFHLAEAHNEFDWDIPVTVQ